MKTDIYPLQTTYSYYYSTDYRLSHNNENTTNTKKKNLMT